jgi:two-component system, NtrC family, response regulator AtoC
LPHLLLVDDETALRAVIAERLTGQGFDVTQAESGERALAFLNDFAFDVLVTDLRLPGVDGQRVIEVALERYPGIIAIVVTGYGTVKDAVDALKRGAADFVTKPFQFDELAHVLQTALEQKRLQSENAYLRQQLDERFGLGAIVGRSPRMRAMFQLVETVASTSTTILIHGETGTGKELVARALHQSSSRRDRRFVALNCSAIPETLLEAELFGHVRGAFTGAIASRQGRIEQADKGTLFLDEVGTMPMSLQMKLLRVLQEREFERLGDGKTIKVDVRIVAATNADLGKLVKDGAFREDLYYRLNVIQVLLPALRERREDIPLLVQHFVNKYSGVTTADAGRDLTRVGTPINARVLVSQDAMRALMSFSWPGNVRQLENAIERGIALLGGRSTIELSDLPPEIQGSTITYIPTMDFPDAGVDLPGMVEQIERDLINRALSRTGGNKAAAATLLNIKRTTLVEKLKRLPLH